MSEVTKLLIGLLGIVIGFMAGLAAHIFIMQRVGGALFERQGVGLLVAFGLCGGGAALLGYLALALTGRIDAQRRKAARKRKKKQRK